MRVDVLPVFVGGDQDFEAMKEGKPFCEFPGDFVGQLRCDLFIRGEGLNKMLVGPSACLVIEPLGHFHFLPDGVGITVETIQQSALCLLIFHDIVQCPVYSRVGRYSFNNCHK